MREVEYYISKDSCGKEYKTKTTTICGFDEIKKRSKKTNVCTIGVWNMWPTMGQRDK